MRPVLEHLPPGSNESFVVQAFDLSYFGTPWHYHPEYELVLIEASEGKRYVGNSVSDFRQGDLSFLGANLPHLYRNPPAYYEKDSPLRAKSIVVHFRESSLGKDFFSLPQLNKVKELLAKSAQGLDIIEPVSKEIVSRMRRMVHESGIRRLVLLLEILDLLSSASDCRVISGPGIVGQNVFDAGRLNSVLAFMAQNFHREISLNEVASMVYMTRTSFCRFFLTRTKRTFSEYLKELRLNHAASLLTEKDMNISGIAVNSGYNNLSNFNRQFKKRYALSPQDYRQIHGRHKVLA